MKKVYFNIVLILFFGFSLRAQWSEQLFNNANVTVLKKVNNVCFAYGIDNNSFQGKLYRSDNNGRTWTAVDSVVFKYIYVRDITYDSAHSNYVICTNAQNGIFISADGNSWATTGIDWSGDAITYINNRLVATSGSGDAGVGISFDGGFSFSSSNSGLVYPYYVHYVTRINNTLYLSLQAFSPCYVSNNAGASWTAQSTGLSNFVNCFYQQKNKLYTGTYLAGVRKYNVNTSAWKAFNKHLPSTSNIWTLASRTDSLFCGGDTIGVWMNVAGIWSDFSSGLPAKTTVNKLLQAGKFMFAGTRNGLWKINLLLPQAIASADVVNNLSLNIPSNNIKIFPTITSAKLVVQAPSLPEKIMLINSDGSIVKEWRNTSEINIADVPNGNYFIRVMLNKESFTQQIIKTD